MSNPLDSDPGSELFAGYEAELKLVQADLSQQLDQIPDLSGEPRKAAIGKAERALDEASELVCSSYLGGPYGPEATSLGWKRYQVILTSSPTSSAKCALKNKTSLPGPVTP